MIRLDPVSRMTLTLSPLTIITVNKKNTATGLVFRAGRHSNMEMNAAIATRKNASYACLHGSEKVER